MDDKLTDMNTDAYVSMLMLYVSRKTASLSTMFELFEIGPDSTRVIASEFPGHIPLFHFLSGTYCLPSLWQVSSGY